MLHVFRNLKIPWHPPTMTPSRLAPKSVDSVIADAAHIELLKFVESRNPGVVDKKPDTALDFDAYLKTADLRKTNALVVDFLEVCGALNGNAHGLVSISLTRLQNTGKRLAAEFLRAKDAELVRSFLVLYCSRQTRKKNTGLGKVTIFLALGPLSCENGLPKFENDPSKDLTSGDALLVGNDTQHWLDTNRGGGFALVSDWTA
jgi:hypothetical protein